MYNILGASLFLYVTMTLLLNYLKPNVAFLYCNLFLLIYQNKIYKGGTQKSWELLKKSHYFSSTFIFKVLSLKSNTLVPAHLQFLETFPAVISRTLIPIYLQSAHITQYIGLAD